MNHMKSHMTMQNPKVKRMKIQMKTEVLHFYGFLFSTSIFLWFIGGTPSMVNVDNGLAKLY